MKTTLCFVCSPFDIPHWHIPKKQWPSPHTSFERQTANTKVSLTVEQYRDIGSGETYGRHRANRIQVKDLVKQLVTLQSDSWRSHQWREAQRRPSCWTSVDWERGIFKSKFFLKQRIDGKGLNVMDSQSRVSTMVSTPIYTATTAVLSLYPKWNFCAYVVQVINSHSW